MICPECGGKMIAQSGCRSCPACGFCFCGRVPVLCDTRGERRRRCASVQR